jgi:N-acetylglucosaminyl-diphospho-decaprenol L-rhamnosyltransferase
VLLTRFNLPSVGVESLIRAEEGWLRGRVELFERYCLPSVRAQTNRDFQWIVYFDPESPEWLRTWIDSHRAEQLFTPYFRTGVSRTELVADISEGIGTPRAGLLTTNLDNDDALAVDFVERLQAVGLPEVRHAVYLSNGLIGSPTGLYRRTDRYNAFCSVVESWDSPIMCWADWHNRLPASMPVIGLRGAPGWLQVIHGSNVSNRVHGTLTSPTPYIALFPGLIDDLALPSRATIAIDRLIKHPARVLRDVARASAKVAILGIFGKDGLSRLKDRWGARTRRPRMQPAPATAQASAHSRRSRHDER